MSLVVSSAWLQAELGATDLVVLDTTWFIAPQQRSAPESFADAHIPGARFFDIDRVSDPDSDLPHMVPSVARFERLATELGIRNDSRVVFYDQQGLFSAARGWWLLKLFGHERVYVLDGGLPRWRTEGRPVEHSDAKARENTLEQTFEHTPYRAAFGTRRLRGIRDVLDNLDTRRELVLDARSRARFLGEVAEPRPGIASGHIPGSVSLPYTTLLNDDHTFKSAEQIRLLLAEFGVTAQTPVVTSCGTGVTAAIVALGIELAGYPPAALYDGSWTEWGGRTDTPKALGAQ